MAVFDTDFFQATFDVYRLRQIGANPTAPFFAILMMLENN
jgi:hypothetical protein